MDTSDKNTKNALSLTLPKISREQWLEESVQEHLNCLLCGTQLAIRHKTDFFNHTVFEEASCPSCGVKNRQGEHGLH